jgi:hypothetical protein
MKKQMYLFSILLLAHATTYTKSHYPADILRDKIKKVESKIRQQERELFYLSVADFVVQVGINVAVNVAINTIAHLVTKAICSSSSDACDKSKDTYVYHHIWTGPVYTAPNYNSHYYNPNPSPWSRANAILNVYKKKKQKLQEKLDRLEYRSWKKSHYFGYLF